MSGPLRNRRGDVALVVAAICFGSTFITVQAAVERVEPIPFLALRFLIGAAVLWPIARRRPRSPQLRRDGTLAGVSLLVGYVLQTIGLQYTSSATSAFITYLLVVFVPILGFLVLGRRPHRITLVGIAVAVIGLVLLTDPGGGAASSGFGKGELLTLGCAVAFAAHVVILGEVAHRHDPLRLANIQILVVGAACVVPGAFLGGYRFPAPALAAAVGTAVLATALAFVLQVYGQRTVPPARAAVVLLVEPVFAALLASVTGDPLTAIQAGGAALILLAVLFCEVAPAHLTGGSARGRLSPDNDRSQHGPSTRPGGHRVG